MNVMKVLNLKLVGAVNHQKSLQKILFLQPSRISSSRAGAFVTFQPQLLHFKKMLDT